MTTKNKFEAFVTKIERNDLRFQVECVAIENANDMIGEGHFQYGTDEYWEGALSTAVLVLDDARSYFPELFV